MQPPSSCAPHEGREVLRSGVDANFISDEGTAGLELAYGDGLKRLTALKDTHVPEGFLRMNANIRPSAPRGLP